MQVDVLVPKSNVVDPRRLARAVTPVGTVGLPEHSESTVISVQKPPLTHVAAILAPALSPSRVAATQSRSVHACCIATRYDISYATSPHAAWSYELAGASLFGRTGALRRLAVGLLGGGAGRAFGSDELLLRRRFRSGVVLSSSSWA